MPNGAAHILRMVREQKILATDGKATEVSKGNGARNKRDETWIAGRWAVSREKHTKGTSPWK